MQFTCPRCECLYASDQADGLCPRCLANMAVHPTGRREPGSPLEVGRTFHGMLVQALIATGGMGVVYRARKPGSDADVALKILPPSLGLEAEFRERFDREARALAGLAHPNIVRLHDFGIADDLMFLVMEFVEGRSLRQLLRDGKVTPARALTIIRELCAALEYAHHERVIHRDVKPDNILLDSSGRVKLSDFGLAKRIDPEASRLTQTNFAVGTPHYMAPEQLENPIAIDHRVDIYSTGVVLYEMLTRELPIGRFPLPSTKAAIDPALDTIICRCLEKDPDLRYASVRELRGALSSVAGAAPEQAEATTPPRPKISSNLEVACPCGWSFFVPAGRRGNVHCPSCGDRISVTQPTPVRVECSAAAGPPPPLKLIAAAVLLMAVGIVFLVLVLSPGPARRDEHGAIADFSPPKDPMPALATPPLVRNPPSTTSTRRRTPPGELRARLDVLVAETNLTGILSAFRLYTGATAEHEGLQARMKALDAEIREQLLQLEEQGLIQDTPERMQAGDRLTGLGDRRLQPSQSAAFAEELRAWLRSFQTGTQGVIVVNRSRRPVVLPFHVPESGANLVVMAHEAALAAGEKPAGVAPPPADLKSPPPRPAIPAPMLEDFRRRMSALPKPYKELLPADDRTRAEALLLSGTAGNDDTTFLTGRLADLLKRCEDEHRSTGSRTKELEARVAEAALQTSTLLCKDGRRIEGIIVEESEKEVRVKSGAISTPILRTEIERIDQGRSAAAEFKTGLDAARGQRPELVRLLAFAKERKLPVQQELAALALVALDPADESSRAMAGLPRALMAGAREADGFPAARRIEYNGRTYTADQLRSELKSLGYVQINGLWCEKVPKSLKIDNLFRDQARLPATHWGTGVQDKLHTERDSVYDYQSHAWVPRTKQVAVARYIGGTGTCMIEVDAPGALIEARVHARSQVPRAASKVAVSVVLDANDPKPKTVYTLSAPGESDSSFDVSEKVAGRTRFFVRAEIIGDGMFLVCDNNDLSVFEVKYVYGKPLERVNALLPQGSPLEGLTSTDARANSDSVEWACRNVAATAASISVLGEALAEVRKETESLYYTREYSLPTRYSDQWSLLRDALSPDWSGMSRDEALKLGAWWGKLPVDDRREFLAAYGVWCSRSRALRAK